MKTTTKWSIYAGVVLLIGAVIAYLIWSNPGTL